MTRPGWRKQPALRSMPPVDGPTTTLVGFTANRTLRHINRYAAVQRGWNASDAALPCVQGWIATHGFPHGLLATPASPPSVPRR